MSGCSVVLDSNSGSGREELVLRRAQTVANGRGYNLCETCFLEECSAFEIRSDHAVIVVVANGSYERLTCGCSPRLGCRVVLFCSQGLDDCISWSATLDRALMSALLNDYAF